MKRPITRWVQVATAIVGLGMSGCGKTAVKEEAKVVEADESAAPENSAPAKPAPQAPAKAPAPAAAAAPAPAKSGAEELLAMGGGPAAANSGQAANPVGGGKQGGAPANYPQSSGPGGGGGTQGGGQTQMPANYPKPGQGGGPGGPEGGGSNGEPGMAGGPGQGAAGGMAAMGANGGAINNTVSDFTTESKGAESFLSALKSRDAKAVAEALALHSRYEASGAHKGDFGDILDETASAEQINKIASEFDGFQIQSLGQRLGEGEVKVILTKQDEKSSMSRTLTMRHEKLGWKVQDYGGKREIKRPQMMGAARKKSR